METLLIEKIKKQKQTTIHLALLIELGWDAQSVSYQLTKWKINSYVLSCDVAVVNVVVYWKFLFSFFTISASCCGDIILH